MTVAEAFGRVGLLGNPSDMYGGRCISFTIAPYAEVSVEHAPSLNIMGETSLHYNGNHDLVKAVLRHCAIDKPLNISYKTFIPIGAGLAGSSAIVIATLRALNKLLKLSLDEYALAELALHVEVDELGISAGFQDRYAISFEGCLYMDFAGKEMLRKEDPPGKVKRLPMPKNMPWFLCLSNQPKTSASVHNPVRQRYVQGDTSIRESMKTIAQIADEGVDALKSENWEALGTLMNKNVALRKKTCGLLEHDQDIISLAKKYGALGAKLAGSGGAVIILADKSDVFQKMAQHYPCFKPAMVRNLSSRGILR